MLEKSKMSLLPVLMTVTPDMAKSWLENNTSNRKVSKPAVEQYAEAMRNGDWLVNGEAIKIAQDGSLLDGQHRLLAIIKANRAVETMVIDGVDKSVMPTIDVGKKRTNGDIISMYEVKYPVQVAGAIAVAYHLTEGKTGRTGNNSLGRVTAVEANRFLSLYPSIADSVLFCIHNRGNFRYRAQYGALHFLFSRKNQIAADRFFLRLFNGMGLVESDPVYRLREKILAEEVSRKKASRGDFLTWIIKAWNAERAGISLDKLHGMGRDDKGRFNVIPRIEG